MRWTFYLTTCPRAALTWGATGRRSGWGLPVPTGRWVSDWCDGSCSCSGSAGSSSPAPGPRSAWSPRRPRCSPRLSGRSRRCPPSRTRALSAAGSWQNLGAPGSPAARTTVVLWRWFLEWEGKEEMCAFELLVQIIQVEILKYYLVTIAVWFIELLILFLCSGLHSKGCPLV